MVDLADPTVVLPPLTGVSAVEADGPRRTLTFDRRTTTAPALIAAVTAAAEVRDLTLEEPAIEDVVRRLYQS